MGVAMRYVMTSGSGSRMFCLAVDREFLCQTQAMPRDCHQIRQTRRQLPRRHLSCGLGHMAELMTRPS